MRFQNTLPTLLYFLLFLIIQNNAVAQSAKAYEKAGDKSFEEKDYYAAFVHFREAMELAPEEVSLWYKYAEVTRQFNAYEEAETYYEMVYTSKETDTFPLAAFWAGQVKKCLGKYNEAQEMFEDFVAKGGGEDYFTTWAKLEIEACRWAPEAPMPIDKIVEVEHLDKKINTPYSEFGALEEGNTLYYSSYRFDFKNDHHLPERKLSKVLLSTNLAKGKIMPKDFNSDEKLTAHTALSLDGERLYFTECQYVTSSDIRCELFYREKDKRGHWQKKAVRLPDIINKKGFTTTHPSIGFDSVAMQEILFFTSDRNGGKGKLDVWYCALDKNKFLEPKNLEPINTPENDLTPFFHTASQTLYFSSDGRSGLGGYDVFRMARQPDWGAPENVGKPVNSSYHDLYFSLNEVEKTAYLSSNRPGSFYLDANNKACCYDIFRVTYADMPEDPNLIPPPVPEAPTTPPPFIPTKLEDFLPLALYFDNDEPDKRTNRTTTKRPYEATFDKYYDRKQDYVKNYTTPLSEEDADDAALHMEDFFENEVKRNYDFLGLFSEILLKRLENGERVEIVIKGYTSPRAKSEYNDNLARRRISSLRNQFDTYKGGIFQSYLKHEKLVISEAPIGEATAAATISDDLFDERNSIYSVAAARERRVEIVEVK